MTIRQYQRTRPRPAADYETVQMSTRMLHHLMGLGGPNYDPLNSPGGFLRGCGGTHVTACKCDSCKRSSKFRRAIRHW